mgnify:CR=1 FL=1
MSSTALQLIQQATGEMGLSVPTTAVGNTNSDVIQQLALLNAVGYELIRKYQWQATSKLNLFQTAYLTTTGTVTSGSAVVTAIPDTSTLSTLYQATGNGILQNSQIVSIDSATQVTLNQQCSASGTAQAITFSKTKYAMPTDYDRQIDRTHWDKTQHWQMIGPETAQQWEWLTSGYISSGPRVRYRIFGDYFQIWPPQGSQHYLGFEYISKYWAATTAGVAKGSFTVDTDTCVFPDRLMVLGLKHKNFQVKGLGDIYFADYKAEESIAYANDAGSQTLAMAPQISEVLISWNQIPDSGFGT